jgi:hypothetical protein
MNLLEWSRFHSSMKALLTNVTELTGTATLIASLFGEPAPPVIQIMDRIPSDRVLGVLNTLERQTATTASPQRFLCLCDRCGIPTLSITCTRCADHPTVRFDPEVLIADFVMRTISVKNDSLTRGVIDAPTIGSTPYRRYFTVFGVYTMPNPVLLLKMLSTVLFPELHEPNNYTLDATGYRLMPHSVQNRVYNTKLDTIHSELYSAFHGLEMNSFAPSHHNLGLLILLATITFKSHRLESLEEKTDSFGVNPPLCLLFVGDGTYASLNERGVQIVHSFISLCVDYIFVSPLMLRDATNVVALQDIQYDMQSCITAIHKDFSLEAKLNTDETYLSEPTNLCLTSSTILSRFYMTIRQLHHASWERSLLCVDTAISAFDNMVRNNITVPLGTFCGFQEWGQNFLDKAFILLPKFSIVSYLAYAIVFYLGEKAVDLYAVSCLPPAKYTSWSDQRHKYLNPSLAFAAVSKSTTYEPLKPRKDQHLSKQANLYTEEVRKGTQRMRQFKRRRPTVKRAKRLAGALRAIAWYKSSDKVDRIEEFDENGVLVRTIMLESLGISSGDLNAIDRYLENNAGTFLDTHDYVFGTAHGDVLSDEAHRYYDMLEEDDTLDRDVFDNQIDDYRKAEREFFGSAITEVDPEIAAGITSYYNKAIDENDPSIYWHAAVNASRGGYEVGEALYTMAARASRGSIQSNAHAVHEAGNELRDMRALMHHHPRDDESRPPLTCPSCVKGSCLRHRVSSTADKKVCHFGSSCPYLENNTKPPDISSNPHFYTIRANHLEAFEHSNISGYTVQPQAKHDCTPKEYIHSESRLLTGRLTSVPYRKLLIVIERDKPGYVLGSAFRCGAYIYTAHHVVESFTPTTVIVCQSTNLTLIPGCAPLGKFTQIGDLDMARAPVQLSSAALPGFSASRFDPEVARRGLYHIAVYYTRDTGDISLNHTPIENVSYSDFSISYSADTVKGYSGAPIYDASSCTVIGVHTGASIASCYGVPLPEAGPLITSIPTNVANIIPKVYNQSRPPLYTHNVDNLVYLGSVSSNSNPQPRGPNRLFERVVTTVTGNWECSDFGMTNPTMEECFIDFSKYDKLPCAPDPHLFKLATEFTHNMFAPHVRGSGFTSHSDVVDAFDLSRSVGFPLNQTWKDARTFFAANGDSVQQAFESWMTGSFFEPFSTVFGKIEIRPMEKIKLKKIRTICGMQRDFLYIQSRLHHEFNENFYKSHLKTWSAVGFTPFYRGWDQMMKSLEFPGWLCLGHDGSRWDSSILWQECITEAEFRFECYPESDQTTALFFALLMVEYFIVFAKCKLPDGSIFQKFTGHNTGHLGTTVKNTYNNVRRTFYSVLKQFYTIKSVCPDYSEILANVRCVMYGDDHVASVSPAFQIILPPSTFKDGYADFGCLFEPEFVEYRPAHSVSFLSMTTGKFHGMYVPIPRVAKLIATLKWGGGDMSHLFIRAVQFHFLSFFTPQRLQFRSLCDTLVRNYATEITHGKLHLTSTIHIPDSAIEDIYFGYEQVSASGSDKILLKFLKTPTQDFLSIFDIMPFCMDCGKPVLDSATYCRNCGSKQPSSIEEKTDYVPPVLVGLQSRKQPSIVSRTPAPSAPTVAKPVVTAISSSCPDQYWCHVCETLISGSSQVVSHCEGGPHLRRQAENRFRVKTTVFNPTLGYEGEGHPATCDSPDVNIALEHSVPLEHSCSFCEFSTVNEEWFADHIHRHSLRCYSCAIDFKSIPELLAHTSTISHYLKHKFDLIGGETAERFRRLWRHFNVPFDTDSFDHTLGYEGEGHKRPKFHYHGNWGGPGFSAGKFTENPDWSVPSVDELDETFKRHDYNYGRMPEEDADAVWQQDIENVPDSYTKSIASMAFKVKSGSRSVTDPGKYPWHTESGPRQHLGRLRHRHSDHEGNTGFERPAEHYDSRLPSDGPTHFSEYEGKFYKHRETGFDVAQPHPDYDADPSEGFNFHDSHSVEIPVDEFYDNLGHAYGDQLRGRSGVLPDENYLRSFLSDVENDPEPPTIPPEIPTRPIVGPGGMVMPQPGGVFVPPVVSTPESTTVPGFSRIGEAKNPGPTGGIGSTVGMRARFDGLQVSHVDASTVRVSGRDYLGSVPSAAAAGYSTYGPGNVLVDFPLDVNFGGFLSRLTRIARLYEMYYVEYYNLDFYSNIATANPAGGDMAEVAMYIDPDVLDDPGNGSASGLTGLTGAAAVECAVNQKGCVVTSGYNNFSVTTDFRSINGGWRYCGQNDAETDPHLHFFGRAVVMSANTATSFSALSVGSLYCTWSFLLRIPSGICVIPNQGMGLANAATGAGLTATNLAGLGSVPFWHPSFELNPKFAFNSTLNVTQMFPLQSLQTITGETVLNPNSSERFWVFHFYAIGTVITAFTLTASGAGGVAPVIVNNTNDPMNQLFIINSGATAAIGTRMIQIPLGASPNGYLSWTLTATTVTTFQIRMYETASVMSTTTPSPHLIVSNPDGTTNIARTIHADFLSKHVDGDMTVCPCSDCVAARNAVDDKNDDDSTDYLAPLERRIVHDIQDVLDGSDDLQSTFSKVVRKKDKAIRYGEAKNPGPDETKRPIRRPLAVDKPLIMPPLINKPAHHCANKALNLRDLTTSFRAPSSAKLHLGARAPKPSSAVLLVPKRTAPQRRSRSRRASIQPTREVLSISPERKKAQVKKIPSLKIRSRRAMRGGPQPKPNQALLHFNVNRKHSSRSIKRAIVKTGKSKKRPSLKSSLKRSRK